jgi:signal transduction histidine kinase
MSSSPSDIDVNALMRGLVHELRNPLSAILTASSLLQPNQEMDEESGMLLEVVQKEARRMNRILTEFSTFVKPPAAYIEDFDIAALVRDIARQLKKEEVIQPHIAIHDELPPTLWVSGDMLQTAQVLRHVLTNSAEAMETDGKMRFAKCEPSSPALCIEDTGEGLVHGALEQAFQPFFSTKPAATGLGLSISRGLIRAFGGELTVENIQTAKHEGSNGEAQAEDEPEHLPQGTRVRIQLPPAKEANHELELDTD